MSDDLVKRGRELADCDARAGEPLGKHMRLMADRIEELEAKLAEIESLMVHLVNFAEQSKATAGSGNSKRREHYRMHSLSEALGQIRKIMKGESKQPIQPLNNCLEEDD